MNDELRSLGSVRARGLLLLAVVALAAGAAGGAIDRLWVARTANSGMIITKFEPIRGRADGPARESAERPVRTDRSMEEERGMLGMGGIPISLRSLTLTDSQRRRIEKISSQFQPAAESVVMTIRSRVAALDLQMRQETMCVLTPQQRADWIAWRKREHLIVEDNDLMMKLVASNSCPR